MRRMGPLGRERVQGRRRQGCGEAQGGCVPPEGAGLGRGPTTSPPSIQSWFTLGWSLHSVHGHTSVLRLGGAFPCSPLCPALAGPFLLTCVPRRAFLLPAPPPPQLFSWFPECSEQEAAQPLDRFLALLVETSRCMVERESLFPLVLTWALLTHELPDQRKAVFTRE